MVLRSFCQEASACRLWYKNFRDGKDYWMLLHIVAVCLWLAIKILTTLIKLKTRKHLLLLSNPSVILYGIFTPFPFECMPACHGVSLLSGICIIFETLWEFQLACLAWKMSHLVQILRQTGKLLIKSWYRGK